AADSEPGEVTTEDPDIDVLVTQTLAGLEQTGEGPVLASTLKRAVLRKDPTFNEADHGFRGFGEYLRHLASSHLVDLREGNAQGDPEVHVARDTAGEDAAFALLSTTVDRLSAPGAGRVHLSGLKTQLRRVDPQFSEKRFGYRSFLHFVKAARARGLIDMEFD